MDLLEVLALCLLCLILVGIRGRCRNLWWLARRRRLDRFLLLVGVVGRLRLKVLALWLGDGRCWCRVMRR